MMDWRMFWEATAYKVLVLTAVLAVMLGPPGCSDADKKMSHAQQVETVKEVVQVAKDLELDVDLQARFGPAYYGLFEGLIIDPGLSLQLHARMSPEDTTKLEALVSLVAQLESRLDPPQEPPE